MILASVLLILSQIINASNFTRNFVSRFLKRGRRAIIPIKLQPFTFSKQFTQRIPTFATGSMIMAATIGTDFTEDGHKTVQTDPIASNKLLQEASLLEKEKVQAELDYNGKLLKLEEHYNSRIMSIIESSNEQIIEEFKIFVFKIRKITPYFDEKFNSLNRRFPEEMKKINSTKNKQILDFIDMIREKLIEKETFLFAAAKGNLNIEYEKILIPLNSRLEEILKEIQILKSIESKK